MAKTYEFCSTTQWLCHASVAKPQEKQCVNKMVQTTICMVKLAMSWVYAFSSRRKISEKHFVALQNSEHGVAFSRVFLTIL